LDLANHAQILFVQGTKEICKTVRVIARYELITRIQVCVRLLNTESTRIVINDDKDVILLVILPTDYRYIRMYVDPKIPNGTGTCEHNRHINLWSRSNQTKDCAPFRKFAVKSVRNRRNGRLFTEEISDRDKTQCRRLLSPTE